MQLTEHLKQKTLKAKALLFNYFKHCNQFILFFQIEPNIKRGHSTTQLTPTTTILRPWSPIQDHRDIPSESNNLAHNSVNQSQDTVLISLSSRVNLPYNRGMIRNQNGDSERIPRQYCVKQA